MCIERPSKIEKIVNIDHIVRTMAKEEVGFIEVIFPVLGWLV